MRFWNGLMPPQAMRVDGRTKFEKPCVLNDINIFLTHKKSPDLKSTQRSALGRVITSSQEVSGGWTMHADLALRMLAELFWTGVLVCLPVLGLTMLVGLLISILQVVTQVQEMSLTFIPKLLTAAISLVVFGPWMLRTLASFSTRLWSDIPSMF
jgi:flagellar biosynthetic protein FliQ